MSKKLLGAVLVAATLAAPVVLAGEGESCSGDKATHAASKSAVKDVTITQVASLQKEKKVTVLDANGADFRKQNGIIPGAVLLTHFQKYDVAKELPATKDSKLVFYCANTQCKASHAAAEKALEAGYTDVSVLPDGLLGWKKSGQPTASVAPQS
ncbi:rhodanese-like domain-containing protein [Vitiosangium sp. GDMCC 1.1324]|uniref:rhodanese-like domain-containing protein n=1 Tax=Vitiosangium sp. (strain GDMCC 1.1324) TaxID=2138576 RepID=UPI000D340386|nr:rhodanese-like domain-containing protein [Vitiosangium sp. GDMCC 1.1324]PTL84397.1 sulfurtransferase [Vitiosangium sp. GDMCC 1.1324]